ncbi:MAG TPA: hypothetical protein VGE54_04150 [Brevundimonas sp.]
MRTLRTLGAAGCIAAVAAACASTPPPSQVGAWLASGRPAPPPQNACGGVADIDLAAIDQRRQAYLATPEGAEAATRFPANLPEAAEALIPADASVVIRALLPPGGLYRNEIRSVVWKGPDGIWMMWRQNKDHGEPPPPPPPPPPPEDSPYYATWLREFGDKPQRPPTDDERWPPISGRLSLQQAATLEAALADPCRAWDPDYYPHEVPLRRSADGWNVRPCPPDGGSYIVDITEPGRPRRGIGAACINDTPTFDIISIAAYAQAGG